MPLITVNVDLGPLKRLAFNAAAVLLLVGVAFYVAFRDQVWKESRPEGRPRPSDAAEAPLLHQRLFTGRGTSGHTFTVTEAKTFHLTVRGSTGSHVVINKLMGPVVYSSGRRAAGARDLDDEVYLEPGEYVLSLVASGRRPAQAFIELR